jgi:hypothetical protein
MTDREFHITRPMRLLAGVICACAAIAALTVLLTVGSGTRTIDDLWRLPLALFMVFVSGSIAARGRFPRAAKVKR